MSEVNAKNELWLPLVVWGGVALLSGTAAAQTSIVKPAQAGRAPAGNVQNGKDLYLKYSCYACHNYAGHGGAAGPRLVPMGRTVESFTTFVRNPATMPPYSTKVLSDAQLVDVWAYVKTLPESPSAKAIPLLNQLLSEK